METMNYNKFNPVKTGIPCLAHNCGNHLSETDLYYQGRFCRECIKREYIPIRVYRLQKGDFFKILQTDTIQKVTNRTETTITSYGCGKNNLSNSNVCSYGANSQQIIYLQNNFYKNSVESLDFQL